MMETERVLHSEYLTLWEHELRNIVTDEDRMFRRELDATK